MQLGFRQVRVRQHDKLARNLRLGLRILPKKITAVSDIVNTKLREFGYTYVSVDFAWLSLRKLE